MQFMVYLGGPIAHQTHADSVEWRDWYRDKLRPDQIYTLSPLRGHPALPEGEIHKPQGYDTHVLTTAPGFTARDSMDIRRADLVVLDLFWAEKVSVGTMIEAGMAHALNKFIVTVMDEDNAHWHGMLRQISGAVVGTRTEAVDVIRQVLLPDVYHVSAPY